VIYFMLFVMFALAVIAVTTCGAVLELIKIRQMIDKNLNGAPPSSMQALNG
jgi:hypothetical protein